MEEPVAGNSGELLAYRIGKLESSHEAMAKALTQIVTEFRMAKWVIGFAVAIMQPIVISVLVYNITKRS